MSGNRRSCDEPIESSGAERGQRQNMVPRVNRRRMLAGLAGTGLAGFAGCSELTELTEHTFEADLVAVPPDGLERFGLEVEDDEIVVEEERTVGGEDVRAEMTSHVVGYETTGEAGGEAQLRTTRDVAAEEVLVTILARSWRERIPTTPSTRHSTSAG
ncbi:hypothetical protein D8S78_11335 [Natrialba swarupiae]|nr:hypothetical protein [Natrialba swarupiae]